MDNRHSFDDFISAFNSPSLIFFPLITIQRFADLSGLPLGVVKNWVTRGYLPTIKKGKYSMINLVVLFNDLKVKDLSIAQRSRTEE